LRCRLALRAGSPDGSVEAGGDTPGAEVPGADVPGGGEAGGDAKDEVD